MRQVSRSAMLTYSVSQMFALVEDVGSYPLFLPWCLSATVHSQDDDTIEASLQMQRGGITKTFRTRNKLRRNEAMDITLLEGPFRHLAGGWPALALARRPRPPATF